MATLPKTVLQEADEIAEWVKGKCVKLCSAILFGSAARMRKSPKDLDLLVVLDGSEEDVNKVYREFLSKDLTFSRRYGIYPELTILRTDSVTSSPKNSGASTFRLCHASSQRAQVRSRYRKLARLRILNTSTFRPAFSTGAHWRY